MTYSLVLLLLIFLVLGFGECQEQFQSAPAGNCSFDGTGGDGQPMIINGERVPLGEAKYQLALLRFGAFICGASLIAPRTAITAGHCVVGFDLDGANFAVRYGSLNLTDDASTVSVLRVVLHPAFTAATFNADIALLTLSERIPLGDTVSTIEIANEEEDELAAGSTITVQGWGQTTTSATSSWLMRAQLTVMSTENCQKIWSVGGQPVLDNVMFCASSRLQSSCKGDSGGPVIGSASGKLVGLISWGSRYCLDEQFPNVYAKLTEPEIQSWIALSTIY